MAADDFVPCDGCKQPLECGGRWPEDDKHKPGQIRGCFAAKTHSLDVATNAGKTLEHTTNHKADPSWEKARAGEVRPGGGFMPYVGVGAGGPMGVKEHGERRVEIERVRDRQKKRSPRLRLEGTPDHDHYQSDKRNQHRV